MPTAPQTALIFDLDDTLVLSHIDFTAVRHRLIDLLEAAGVADEPRELRMRRSLPDLADRGAAVGPALAAQMWEVIRAAELQGLARARPAEQAVEVLGELGRRGHRLALLTNNARDGLMARLQAWHLASPFDIVATRDDVPALKPAPGGVLHVLTHLPGMRGAYLIGDAWIDAQAARDANIPFIGIGGKRATVESRGIPIWAWVATLPALLSLDLTDRP